MKGEVEDGETPGDLDFKDLDSEGRAIVVVFGLFVLINVYCRRTTMGLKAG